MNIILNYSTANSPITILAPMFLSPKDLHPICP
jgi:hypothetical protein